MTGPPRKRTPARVAEFLPAVLDDTGLARRLEQAGVVEMWAELVGTQIGRVTRAISVTPDGVLRVGVETSGWMHELTMMAPDLLASINTRLGRPVIRRIHFRLLDPGER